MDKKLNRIVDKMLIELFQKSLPEFEYLPIKHRMLASVEKVFRWVPAEKLHCFIIYMPDRKGKNRFTFELGWSKKGRFPELNMRPSIKPAGGIDKEFSLAEYIDRIGILNGNYDYWWEIERLEENHVESVINNAVQYLKQFGIPYLKRLVEYKDNNN